METDRHSQAEIGTSELERAWFEDGRRRRQSEHLDPDAIDLDHPWFL